MQALVCHRLADDLAGVSLADIAPPRPGPGEVAIEVRAAALNFPDLLMTRGAYQHRPELPFVLGMEGAGTVCELGEGVAGLGGPQLGDAVCFGRKEGAIAQRVVASADSLRRMPAGFDWAEAAAFQVGALTAWVALVVRGQLRAGEVLLVHGASGGTGAAAVQLGRHLGAHVIATGTSEDKLAPLAALGAEHLLVTGEGFRERVKALTHGRGADVIFDPVGGDVFDESVRCIAPEGRLLVIGFASGRIPTLAANLALIKGFSLVGVRAGEYLRGRPDHGRALLDEVARLPEQGDFRPLVGARFPLASAMEAMHALAQRRVPGKIVIEMP
jgi:NADPH2:quinone reductase